MGIEKTESRQGGGGVCKVNRGRRRCCEEEATSIEIPPGCSPQTVSLLNAGAARHRLARTPSHSAASATAPETGKSDPVLIGHGALPVYPSALTV